MAQKIYDFRDNLPPYDVEDPMDLATEIENIETRLNLISPESTEWQTLEEERVLKTARHTQLCFITNYGKAYGYHEAEVPIPGNITLTVDSPIEHFIQYERYKSSISRECSRMCDFLSTSGHPVWRGRIDDSFGLYIDYEYRIASIMLWCNWNGKAWNTGTPYRDFENHHLLFPPNLEHWTVFFKYEDEYYHPRFDTLYAATKFVDMLCELLLMDE